MTTMELTQYEPIKAQIAELLAQNDKLVFNYRDPTGNKDARSHVYALRLKKGEVERVRKTAKADALEYGRKVDSVAKELTAALETAIAVHQTPIAEIEAEEQAKRDEAARIEAEKKAAEERAEQERQAAILKAAQEEAEKARAEIEAMKAKQREDDIRREAAEQARREAEERVARAEREKLAAEREAIATRERALAEKEQAEAEKKRVAQQAKEDQEEAVRAAEQRAKEQAEAEERAKARELAKKAVRREIISQIKDDIQAIMDAFPAEQALGHVAAAIYDGEIRNVFVRKDD